MVEPTDEDEVITEVETPSEQDSPEETKQGNIASLGSNNAEVHSEEVSTAAKEVKIKDKLTTEKSKTSDQQPTSKNNESDSNLEEQKVNTKSDKQVINDDPEITNAVAPDSLNNVNNTNEHPEAPHSETQTGSDIKIAKEAEAKAARSAKPTGYKYELLDLLFDFILTKTKRDEVNPVLSGYFEKVVLALLSYKQKEVMSYIYTKETLMDKLLDHVYDKSICDVIIKILNISNSTNNTANTSVNNDSGDLFRSPRTAPVVKEELPTYENSRNEIIHKLIDKLIRAKTVEEYWNASNILCEMAKFSQLFEFLMTQEVMDKISVGLENYDEEGIRYTLRLYNVILREYSKDGTNKRINISNLQDEEEELGDTDDMLGLKFEGADDGFKERNSSVDKSGDQSGSNLSKNNIVKENEKENQFMACISNVLPLIIQLIKDDENPQFMDTSYKSNVRVLGSMKLEVVEMIRII